MTANLERMDRQLQQMEAKNKAKMERLAMEQEKRRKILEDVSGDRFFIQIKDAASKLVSFHS